MAQWSCGGGFPESVLCQRVSPGSHTPDIRLSGRSHNLLLHLPCPIKSTS